VSVPPAPSCVQGLPGAPRARSIVPVRAVKETRRYWLPLCAAVLCLFGASFGVPPLVAYALIMLSFGFCFDAATAWLARAGGTGGMRQYKQ